MNDSLASAQLKQAKIKAMVAREQLADLVESILKKECAVAGKREVKNLIRQNLAALEVDFLNALNDEPDADETKIHYLLSDRAFTWLLDLANKAKTHLNDRESAASFASAVKPKDLITVSQWAEKNRVIKTGSNMPGAWRNENSPHLTEIMDSISEHSPVREVTFIKSSGVGGSEVLYNALGYIMNQMKNKDVILVVPTLDLRDREYNPRIDKMIKETPVLTELVSHRSRDTTKRQDMIQFGEFDARLIKTGANSPDSLRAAHVPIALADEFSAFPWDVGGEGSADTLISNRLKTFSRSKFLKISTPTTAGECAISESYANSDQRKRLVACPNCSHRHILEFKNFHWDYRFDGQTGSDEQTSRKQVHQAWFVCPSCSTRINEHQKNDLLDSGVWIAQRPEIKNHRGYHVNAFYIKFGLGETWPQIAQKWIDAQGDTSKLKTFVNTYLGEAWKDQTDQIEAGDLLARLETFPEPLPESVVCAGVDVQKDRLECSVYAFEPTEEAWAITHLIIPGDTTQPEPWKDLSDELNHFGVAVACVDSGYNTDMVHEFCDPRKWCFPVKGVGGMGRPLIEDKIRRNQRLRRRRKKGRPVEPIGTDQANALIYARLRLPKPGSDLVDKDTGEIIGQAESPGYIHYPNQPEFDDEFFLQLTAEALVTKKRAGRTVTEWVQVRKRNEAIDCLRYALAAFRLSKDTPGLKSARNNTAGKNKVTKQTDQSSQKAKPKVNKGRLLWS